jgi:uncharacterized protein YkwD
MSKFFAKIILTSIVTAIVFNPSVGWAKPTNTFQSHPFQIANSNDLDGLEKAIFQKINQYRRSQNLPTLKFDDRLSEQARIHSQAMASKEVPFSHDRFEERTNAIAKAIDYRSIAENVAYNQGFGDPATRAIDGWLKSPSHRQNIESNFNLTGIGVAKNARNEYYFTQIFVLQR